MRTTARLALAVIVSVVALFALYVVRHALLMFYVATVLAILFDPFVERLERLRVRRFRINRGLATAVVCLAVAGVLLVVVLVILPPIMTDASRLERDLPETSANALDWIHAHLPFSGSLNVTSIRQWLMGALPAQSAVFTIGATALDVLTTGLLAIYMLADGPRAFQWLLSLVSRASRPRLEAALRAGGCRMQGWVSGQGLLMLIHGGSALVTFWLLGLPYFLALAVFAAVINVIPVLGPVLTLAAASLVAIVHAPGKLVGVVAFYLVYHNAEGLYLQPRIMESAVGIPGVAVVAALVIGDEVAGFVGMALSVPTAVLLAEMKRRYTD